MTTPAELLAQTPGPTRGIATELPADSGVWRFVLELADPSAGAAVQWYDLTAIVDPRSFTGYEYTRGADGYLGRFRASVVTLDLYADDDSLAPWNDDTSATFGTHVALGPGLLIRAGLIRVAGGVVAEWLPRFTNKVESWRDSSYSRGKVRQHRITARDLLTSLVGVPLPARPEENWSERMYHFLVDSGWPYGSLIYGAQYEADTTTPIKVLAARPAASTAINELDTICDPVGLVWYTNRIGQLVLRPRVDDTFHADAFAAGATGDEYPGTVTPVDFVWWACEPDPPGELPDDFAAYAMDTQGVEPFGFDKSELNVINHVRITTPASGSIVASVFDDDDPASIDRFDRKTYQAQWVAANDVVAAQLLQTRAWAQTEARPLNTTAQLEGFMPGPANLDYLGYVAIQHRNADDGLTCFGNGWLRYYRETLRPFGCDIDWAITFVVDIYASSSEASMLPVENLHLVGVVDTAAEFGWNYPMQTIAPTHVQYRLMNTASMWSTSDYPGDGLADALAWTGLAPLTTYTFQVRLIRIVDGIVTHFSPTRSITVETAEATVPGIPGDDGVVPLPPPSCAAGEIQSVAWELYRSDTGGDIEVSMSGWTLYDSDTIDDEPWEVHFPDDAPTGWYQYRTQSFCGGIGSGWAYGDPFPRDCVDPDRLDDPPFDDADLVAYWPKVCMNHVEEAVSGEAMSLGSAFDRVDFFAGDPVLYSFGQGHIGTGSTPNLVPTTSDITLAFRAGIHNVPTGGALGVFNFGGASIAVVPDGVLYKVRALIDEVGGSDTSLTATDTYSPVGQHYFAITHDVSAGVLRLYVDAEEIASALSGVGARVEPFGYSMRLPSNSWITDVAVWDRVLDAEELPGAPPLDVTIDVAATQTDPTSDLIVYFDVVFRYPVTGFLSGDVVLSGSAGATTASVADSGDHMHYTVAVSGMSTTGQVIADIPAGAATSIATGNSTPHSTSTDHIIAWVNPVPVDIPIFLNVASGIGTTNDCKSITINEPSIPRTKVMFVCCTTRNSSAVGAPGAGTIDTYNGGTAAGTDLPAGTSGGGAIAGAAFGTRSMTAYRQDWLNFGGASTTPGDEYVVQSGASDINNCAAFYRVPFPWRIRQAAHGSTATTTVSATLASPVAAGSRLVIGIGTVLATTVTSGPVGFTLDGTITNASNRANRGTFYRSLGSEHTGETTFTATVSSTTGGAGMTVIEYEQGDTISTNWSSAIRAASDLLLYYPCSHTLGNIDKNWGGSLGVSQLNWPTTGFPNVYATAGPDGRSYLQHLTATNPMTIVNHAQLSPIANGGLTIGFAIKIDSLAAVQTITGKWHASSAFNREWEIRVETSGALTATTFDFSASASPARTRTTAAGTISTGTWYVIYVRFGNGTSDFPKIRINGADVTGTTSGTLASAPAGTANVTVGARTTNSTSQALAGSIAHLHYIGTDVANSVLDTLGAAADLDGWY